MNRIVIDMEWNIPASRAQVATHNEIRLVQEIIEIGAVKLNVSGEMIDQLRLWIKPEEYHELHWKIRELTGIEQEKLDTGISLKQAIECLREWCGEAQFFSWGSDDFPVLKQNLVFYGLPIDWMQEWYNLQQIFNWQTDRSSNQKSLSYAMEYFEIENTEPLHDALTDAVCAAKVAACLDLNKGINDAKAAVRMMKECEQRNAYFSRGQALRAAKKGTFLCPECKQKLPTPAEWKGHRGGCYTGITSCGNGKTYLIRIRLYKNADGTFCFKTTLRQIQRVANPAECVE